MQVLHHLYLIEISVTQIISSQLAKGEHKNVEERPIQRTTNRLTKIKAPSFSIPSTNFITLKDMTEKLSKSRKRFMRIIDSTDKQMLAQRT